MSKQISSKSVPGVKGGKGHMQGFSGSGSAKPFSPVNTGGKGGGKGGKTKMAGYSGVKPSKTL